MSFKNVFSSAIFSYLILQSIFLLPLKMTNFLSFFVYSKITFLVLLRTFLKKSPHKIHFHRYSSTLTEENRKTHFQHFSISSTTHRKLFSKNMLQKLWIKSFFSEGSFVHKFFNKFCNLLYNWGNSCNPILFCHRIP